jgi:hypothetical protein
MRRKIAVAALAALAVGVSGCSTADGPPTTSPSRQALSDRSSELTDGSRGEHIEAEDPEPSPTHDDESDADAISVAAATMAAYLRRDVSQRDWLEGLEPHLTTAAVVALSSVDPASIPALTAAGNIAVERDASGYLARVAVSTEGGSYRLLLVRDGSGPWLVSQIAPPDGAS